MLNFSKNSIIVSWPDPENDLQNLFVAQFPSSIKVAPCLKIVEFILKIELDSGQDRSGH